MFQCLSWVHFIPAALVIHALKSLLPWLCIPLVNVQVHFIPVYPWFPRCCWSSWRFSWCIWVGQVVCWVTLSYGYCFLVHFFFMGIPLVANVQVYFSLWAMVPSFLFYLSLSGNYSLKCSSVYPGCDSNPFIVKYYWYWTQQLVYFW